MAGELRPDKRDLGEQIRKVFIINKFKKTLKQLYPLTIKLINNMQDNVLFEACKLFYLHYLNQLKTMNIQ